MIEESDGFPTALLERADRCRRKALQVTNARLQALLEDRAYALEAACFEIVRLRTIRADMRALLAGARSSRRAGAGKTDEEVERGE